MRDKRRKRQNPEMVMERAKELAKALGFTMQELQKEDKSPLKILARNMICVNLRDTMDVPYVDLAEAFHRDKSSIFLSVKSGRMLMDFINKI